MSVLLSILSAVFWGVLLLSLLVFVHEGGHYLAARSCGIRVTEFFLGMPCRFRLSHKSKKYGTQIGVTPILLGGYTRICGMEGASDELLAPALALVCKRGRVRVEDLARELGCDVDRAYGLVSTLADWAAIEPYYDPALGEKPNQSTYPEAFQTLARDAQGRTEYDRGHDFTLDGSTAAGEPCCEGIAAEELLQRERGRTYLGCGFGKRLFMLVAGPAINIALAFVIVVAALMCEGVTYYQNVSQIGAVEEGSYAEAAGLLAGDVVELVGEAEVASWEDLVSALQPYLAAGQDFSLTVDRDGAELVLDVDLPDGEAVDLVGISASTYVYHPSFTEAASAAVNYAKMVGEYAVRLIMPQHTMEVLEESSSVVGISTMASEAAASGIYDFAVLVAAVSMSLGFMNLLPIPPLDGGKILIEVVQLVIRRPLPQRAVNAISYVGLAFFLFVFAFALKNDISALL